MKHTFLFTEGVWIASGVYYDENNNRLSVEGRSEITHKKKVAEQEHHDPVGR